MRFKDTNLPQRDQMSLGDLLLLPCALVLFFFSLGSSPPKSKTLNKSEQRGFLPAEREGPNTRSLDPAFYTLGVLEKGRVRPKGTQPRGSTGSTRLLPSGPGHSQRGQLLVSLQYLL